MQLSEMLTNEKLQAAFNLFDIDQNGRITIEEIKSLLGGGGLPAAVIGDNSLFGSSPDNPTQQYGNEIWKELMGEGDANDDGEITFQEFKQMMKKMLHK
jgi:calcium-dependent protein kinase